jgi:peptidoglycan/xylan/chitin deacetylase (PgdA/CDA1 family)
MTRWDWSWEDSSVRRTRRDGSDEQQPPHASERDASPEDTRITHDPPPSGDVRFRRRRVGAGLGLLGVLVLILGVLHSRGPAHHASPPSHRSAAPVRLTAAESEALTTKAENKAIDSVLSYTPIVSQGGTKGNEVALTFDDGPGPYTQRLVKVLNSLHIHATFFAIGEEEQYFSAGTIAELRSGDVVGDHTETHPMMAQLSRHDQHEELFEQILRLQLLGAPTPRLFRPPYGSFNATTLRELHAMHLLMVLWSVDTADYTRPGVPTIVKSALDGAHPGAIILMHDAGGERSQTIAALPLIVHGLRERGLHPVTIPRLLLDDPPPRGLPVPKSLAGD